MNEVSTDCGTDLVVLGEVVDGDAQDPILVSNGVHAGNGRIDVGYNSTCEASRVRKSYPVVSRTTIGPYRVVLREISVHKTDRTQVVTGWEVFVGSAYDPTDQPLKRVNYGRYGYRRGFFRYLPHMFVAPTMTEAFHLAKVAAYDRTIAIVEMLRDVKADLLHA